VNGWVVVADRDQNEPFVFQQLKFESKLAQEQSYGAVLGLCWSNVLREDENE
jgi:hypothetical protein